MRPNTRDSFVDRGGVIGRINRGGERGDSSSPKYENGRPQTRSGNVGRPTTSGLNNHVVIKDDFRPEKDANLSFQDQSVGLGVNIVKRPNTRGN